MELHLDPQSEAMAGLLRLVEREHELRTHVGEVERGARAAGQERVDAREALTELECRAATEPVSAASRRKAEDRVTQAEQAATALWPARLRGAERAAREGRHAIQRHIAEHFNVIVSELEANGAAAAEEVDHAAEAFLAATARRAEAERALIGVVATVRSPMGPNDVSRATSDEAVRAVSSFIQRGGENAPVFRIPEPASALPESMPA
jgi:hypothetical protein